MKTDHRIYFSDAKNMHEIPSCGVELVVTSPPYPMIEMWDPLFLQGDPQAAAAIRTGDGPLAFERMHRQLDPVWAEVQRILKPGGIACLNIGDATRSLRGDFRLYPNHARILARMTEIGFTVLPAILWRKQTNAPNKFMGSGMYPAGAYVTLEHEYILICRKGGLRGFKDAEAKRRRRESALFWEERNTWYSDIWTDLKGTPQRMGDNGTRKRSGAFPIELPCRLINMFSVKADTVVDPFAGTGTTMLAAMACGRRSIGYEIEPALRAAQREAVLEFGETARAMVRGRLDAHLAFVGERTRRVGAPKYINGFYGFPVMTRQERDLIIEEPTGIIEAGEGAYKVFYSEAARDAVTPESSTGSAPVRRSRREKQLQFPD